ncbi:hypothetical protein R1sor_016982 [Riccia sorocarpa]|uniref:U-box domain-containing protein n=1 Tax=Riccia sorocarpa TaxID=122646 RepID=A0ABD3I997_9MARC
MGLVVRPNGISSNKTSGPPPPSSATDRKRFSKGSSSSTTNSSSSSAFVSSRKKWTLFILKQNVSYDQKQTESSNKLDTTTATASVDSPVPLKPLPNNNNYSRGGHEQVVSEKRTDGTEVGQQKRERLRGLATIVQDVLSRSLSDLRSKDIPGGGRKSSQGAAGGGGGEDTASEVSSISFRMQLLDRCETGLGSARLRCASSSSLNPSDGDISFRYSQRMNVESTPKFEGLIEKGKRATESRCRESGQSKSARAEEYETVVERLNDPRATIRLLAATAVREATRNSAQAREDLWRAGAIPPLVNLLQETEQSVCYMATVALLNLAIGSVRNKQAMAECGAIPILVRLMRPESTTQVRESATTVILSLAASDQLKPSIGSSGAIVYLSDILSSGTTQGRSDSVRALLNLSIFKGNRVPMVQAGVVPSLNKVIVKDAKETAEKAVILLSHLFSCKEGRETITADEGTVSVLIQVLKRPSFSQSCKEQTVLMLLALSSKMTVRREAVVAQGILPSVVEIALLGSSPRIQEKASKLLRIIKEHRTDEGIVTTDRSSDLNERSNGRLERQYSSSSTADTTTSTYIMPTTKGPVVRSISDRVEMSKDGKEVKYSGFFRSLVSRSMRSDYLACRAGVADSSRDESPTVSCKILRSFCSSHE